ncbi:MAG: hypothetical protein MMC33_004374 [Icmadophila ericetorum]|nr:hypothetical protein [Icmadophila ericetorum]
MSSLPLPQPPFIPLPGISNLRSLAPNIPTTHPPGLFRPNHIFRSAEPSGAMSYPSTLATLTADLHITTIFDLRSQPEVTKNIDVRQIPLYAIEEAERVFAPVFAETDYSPEQIAKRFAMYGKGGTEGFVWAYSQILIHGVGSFTKVFEHVRDWPGRAILIHCSAGKDRTGVLAALMLELVGVEDEVIAEEYQLTEVGLGHWKEQMIEMLLKDPVMEGKREYAENMIGAKVANMIATLALIRETYGSAEGYLETACGFSDQDISTIRKNLVEETKKDSL